MQNGLKAFFFFLGSNCLASQVSPPAEVAFQSYIANLEARLARQHAKPETYLAVLSADRSDIQVEPVNGGTWQVGGALLHHGRGAAFVPMPRRGTCCSVLKFIVEPLPNGAHWPHIPA